MMIALAFSSLQRSIIPTAVIGLIMDEAAYSNEISSVRGTTHFTSVRQKSAKAPPTLNEPNSHTFENATRLLRNILPRSPGPTSTTVPEPSQPGV